MIGIEIFNSKRFMKNILMIAKVFTAHNTCLSIDNDKIHGNYSKCFSYFKVFFLCELIVYLIQ